MSEHRASRQQRPPRTDRQILDRAEDLYLLAAVERGQLTRASGSPGTPWMLDDHPVLEDLRRLAREGLLLVGFAGTTPPTLLPRGMRLLRAARGEEVLPTD